MYRSIGRILAAGIVLSLSVPTAFAVPATDPTAQNIARIRDHYRIALDHYSDDLQVFTDVSVEDRDFESIAWFQKNGFVTGFPDGSFRPEDTMTRAVYTKLLLRSVYSVGELRTVINAPFPDVLVDSPDAPYIQFAREKNLINYFGDGTFRPDAPVTSRDVQVALGTGVIPYPSDDALTRRQVLEYLYRALPENTRLPFVDFSDGMTLTIEGRDILANGEPVRGIFANWLIDESFDAADFRQEIMKMRRMGINGIATEIGWEQIESREGRYNYPEYFEDFLDEAEAQGMWVAILLAPHYTPDWLYKKYGDIYLYNSEGVRVPKGEYTTFAFTSPAVQDQARWQKNAVDHYTDHENVIAFFLSNEQAYGREHMLDYSTWTATAWDEWRDSRNLSPVPMPRTRDDENYLTWQRFRQDMLNTYLNTVYRAAVQGRTRFVPISHKVIFYESTSAFAELYGLHPTPEQLQMDIVGADIYGLTPNVYPAQNAFHKPVMVVETNLPGDWDADTMFQYLIYQYTQGIAVQSIFRWNAGTDLNVMYYPNGTAWKKTAGIERAARVLRMVPRTLPEDAAHIGIIMPTNSIAADGENFELNQYHFDDIMKRIEALYGNTSAVVWSDDLMPDHYFRVTERSMRDPKAMLAPFDMIIAVTNHLDDQVMDSAALQEWVMNGGMLIMDTSDQGLLGGKWLGVAADGRSSLRYGKGTIRYCALATCNF